MRHSIQQLAFFGGGLLISLAAMTGCDDSCRANLTCWPYSPQGTTGSEGGAGGTGGHGSDPICPEDPAEGEIDPRCGIWVSSSTGDDGNDGVQASPVKTLARAIVLAQDGSPRIYACGEEYSEAVALPAGISLFGGFDCANHWHYVGAPAPARIVAPPMPAALMLLGGDGVALLGDVEVEATEAQGFGASSIAVLALPNSRAHLRRAILTAGDGADGEGGEPGHHDGQSALKGLTGNDGIDACTMDPGLGGTGKTLECGDGAASISGQGGDGNEVFANDGLDGFQPPDPNFEGYGEGGKGESAALPAACTPGIGGAHGQDGEHGLGGSSHGQLTINGFVGASGTDGKSGTPGQGGGGGGASLGKALCGASPHGGAGGGAGGTGGCGGKAGKGGQAGGSSIALALLSDGIIASDVDFLTGRGGKGGDGGALQPGGQGGLPGYGGLGFGGLNGAQGACAGGAGGQGGDGGNGGGGRGGHSVAVAHTLGSLFHPAGTISHSAIAPGEGGDGGNPASMSGRGQEGEQALQLVLDP